MVKKISYSSKKTEEVNLTFDVEAHYNNIGNVNNHIYDVNKEQH